MIVIGSALANISTVVTACVGWVTEWMACINAAGNEVLLVYFCLPLVGLGIGALKRLAS